MGASVVLSVEWMEPHPSDGILAAKAMATVAGLARGMVVEMVAVVGMALEALAVVEAIHQSEVMEQKLKATVVEHLSSPGQVRLVLFFRCTSDLTFLL